MINLINAQSIKGEMCDETIVTLNRFWDSRTLTMTSMTLAKRTGSQAVDEAYALGLFHDCGIPLMLKRFPNYMSVLEKAYANAGPNGRVVDTENTHFNTNHAVVGYYTAKSWRLPEHLTTPCLTITTTRWRSSATTRRATITEKPAGDPQDGRAGFQLAVWRQRIVVIDAGP